MLSFGRVGNNSRASPVKIRLNWNPPLVIGGGGSISGKARESSGVSATALSFMAFSLSCMYYCPSFQQSQAFASAPARLMKRWRDKYSTDSCQELTGAHPCRIASAPVVVPVSLGAPASHRHAPTVEARRPAIGTAGRRPFQGHGPLEGYVLLVLFMLLNVERGCDTFTMRSSSPSCNPRSERVSFGLSEMHGRSTRCFSRLAKPVPGCSNFHLAGRLGPGRRAGRFGMTAPFS